MILLLLCVGTGSAFLSGRLLKISVQAINHAADRGTHFGSRGAISLCSRFSSYIADKRPIVTTTKV
jgi:hypothetical protein